MKKIIMRLIMLLALGTTLYVIFIWEPTKDDDIASSFALNSTNINSVSKEVDAMSKSIYKIDKNKINQSISNEEREKISDIIKKVSTVDSVLIREQVENNDEEGIKNMFIILERRLSKEDFNNIKQILSPYIDFSIIKAEV